MMPFQSLPDRPGLSSIEWMHQSTIGTTISPFTFRRKTYNYGASMMMAICVVPAMTYQDSLTWKALFAQLKQTGEAFYFGPGALQSITFDRIGRVGGNPVLQSNHTSGSTFHTRGFNHDNPATMKAGWYFAIQNDEGNEDLYMITEDITGTPTLDSNGNPDGVADIKVFPALRNTYTHGKWLHFINPKGLFYVSDFPSFRYDSNKIMQPLIFEVSQL